ncbi:MAG: ascorbate-dependent monooxygenase [Planctomycetia bacterium]|nr:ascorbate-dependent monooxygenase [Planctomycetia bacterium]
MPSALLHLASALLTTIAGAAPSAATPDAPTFSRHVAPILWKNCASCHRPGEVGPFSLLSYGDAAKRATFLADITAERRMPPWKAEPDFGHFLDERILTDDEIKTLRDWAQAGAPEGDPKDLPVPPKFVEGWQLGEPDLILEMPEPFEVRADGPDIYRCFVLPIPTTENRTVAAAEFRPGNRRVVHHAIMYLDANGAARKKDEQDPGQGYSSFGGPGVLPTGGLGGWAPGAMPRKLPEGTGKFLRKGSDLVLQLHYHPDGKPATDRSMVGIYFTKKPATTIVGGLAILNTRLAIPAGDKQYTIEAKSEPLPVDVNVLGLGPHMHLLGRQMKVTAATPAGETVPLIWIKDWDFNWQGSYGYAKPIRLPKGSVIHVAAIYDNSEANPHNPNSPPKRVTWGEQTTDEMCLVSIMLTTDSLGDLRKVVGMRGARLGGALAGGAEAEDLMTDEEKKLVGADTKWNALVDLVIEQGFPIPPAQRERAKIFDSDDNGRISKKEFDAIPKEIQARIRDTIREKMREAAGSR